jgi:tetratricopeptide (TPR) repeat protein
MKEKKVKIVMNSMFGNEEHVIERMLESCYKYIDYWVVQVNGSDNTKNIVQRFFDEKGIPGFLYETEWKGMGYNRDHTVQKCLEANHGCDWILRMDADEQLAVDDDFNWQLFEDFSIQSFNITAQSSGGIYYRTWFWNAKLPWYFHHDVKHEVIALKGSSPPLDNKFQMVNLPRSFRHVISNDGITWTSSMKFLRDALELEADQVCSSKILENDYHLFYIGKSYNDCYLDGSLPFGKIHGMEYARRTIFYLEEYLNRVAPKYKNREVPDFFDEMAYFSIFLIGNALRYLEQFDKAIETFLYAELYCPDRNEHLVFLAETYEELEKYEEMLEITKKLIAPDRKNPFPKWYFLIYTNCYQDTGSYVAELNRRARSRIYLDVLDDPYVSSNSISEFPGIL